MKSKYFKLKLLLILSLLFCVVGGTGSFFMIAKGMDKAENYIENNIKMETKEVFKTKEDIEIVDILEFARNYKNVVVLENSTDEYNLIEVRYNKNSKEIFAEVDKENNKKVNLWYKSKFNERLNRNSFDILKYEIESAIHGNNSFIFYPKVDDYIEKITIKVKEPIELVYYNNFNDELKLDQNLINNTVNYKYYDLISVERFNVFGGKDFNIKGFSRAHFSMGGRAYNSTINVEVSEMNNFYIEAISGGTYNFDVKNVKDKVTLDFSILTGNVKILNAKNVLLINTDSEFSYKVKYKENGENREYIINNSEEVLENTDISIDAENIWIKTQDGIKKIK